MNIKWPDEASTAAFSASKRGAMDFAAFLAFGPFGSGCFPAFRLEGTDMMLWSKMLLVLAIVFPHASVYIPGSWPWWWLKMRMIMLMINGHYPQHHDSDHENQFISLWFDNDYLLWVLMMMLVMMMLMIKKEIAIINVNKSDRETVVLDDIDHHP